MKERAECSLRDTTFGRWVFPGCGAVYFERTAMEDLFKVDLGREARRPNHSFCPGYSNLYKIKFQPWFMVTVFTVKPNKDPCVFDCNVHEVMELYDFFPPALFISHLYQYSYRDTQMIICSQGEHILLFCSVTCLILCRLFHHQDMQSS